MELLGLSLRFILSLLLLLLLLLSPPVQTARFTNARRNTTTSAVDIEALKKLKEAVSNPALPSASCLASWNFSHDPCASISTSYFICGFRCDHQANPMRVTEVTLDSAGYAGTLSPYIGNLSSLQVLDVSANAFYGSIPESFTGLRSLLKLELSQNNFSGGVPESLGKLEKLQYLSLASNVFEGPLPASLNRLRALERLSVFNNRLSGSLPPMNNMVKLLYFDCSSNLFSGTIPSKLPSSIMELLLSMNKLQGELPKLLGSLKQLEVLDLSHNELSGPVDAWLFTLPSLQQLNLAYNRFECLRGVPRWEQVVDDSQLVEIDLSFNRFQGQLPVFFVQMKRLTALSLGHNQFTGFIPIEYALKSVRMLIGAEPLMRLYLESNFLAGELPSPFLSISPGQVAGSFVGNCLQHCPTELFFCQGGDQRPTSDELHL